MPLWRGYVHAPAKSEVYPLSKGYACTKPPLNVVLKLIVIISQTKNCLKLLKYNVYSKKINHMII